MAQRKIINIAKKYKELLLNTISFDSLYLYGSYAKGNARKHSDIDIAVFINNFNYDYMDFVKLLWKISSKVDSRIEPVLIIPNEEVTGFDIEIQKTGILIN